LGGQAANRAHDFLHDRLRELALLLLQFFVVVDEHALQRHHLALPLVDALGECGLAQHVALLLDVFALFLKIFLLLVELALLVVEDLLQRGLCAQAVFGLHDGALGVDHGDFRLRMSLGRREQHGGHGHHDA
jgi:hypothetical protein